MRSFALRVAAAVLALVAHVAAAPVVVDDAFVEARVGTSMELAYDPSGALGVDDVLAGRVRFEPSEKDAPSFGYREGAEWVRLRIDDRRSRPGDLVLTLGHPITDRIEVTGIDAAGRRFLEVVGDQVPYAAWSLKGRLPSVPVAPGTETVLVRVTGEASHQLPLVLRTKAAWASSVATDNVVQSLYYGALLVMLVYNLLIWAAVGLRIYGAYVGFLLSYGVVSLSLNGTLHQLLGLVNGLPILDRVPAMSMAVVGFSSLAFVSRLLDWGELRARCLVVIRAFFFVAGGVAVVSLALRVSIGLRLCLVFIGLWATAMIGLGVVAVRRGERAGRLYLIAWSAFILSTVFNVARTFGLVPNNALTAAAPQIGSVIEFLLLSFALADRIKQLQQEVIAKGELALAHANEALLHAEAAKKASDEALAAREMAMRELEERRRLQGELDVATQQLTQAENMATLGMLMAGIAHDIRNPIGAVRGAGEVMSDLLPKVLGDDARARAESGELVREALGWIEQGTRTMDAISLAMRNQSRGGATEAEPMNLEEVVNEALVLCRSRTKLYQLETKLEPVTIVGDATGVGQLVMNLVSNAADALAEQQQADWRGRHAILVEARVVDGEVRIGVHDSGPGVPEAIRAKILEPFFTTKPRGHGTGLGLAIVQRVVKQHGGALTIDRSPTLGGARFVARWPRGT